MGGVESTCMPPFPPAGLRPFDQLLRQLGSRDPDIGSHAGIVGAVLDLEPCLTCTHRAISTEYATAASVDRDGVKSRIN
jgi:hypothetical protein